MCVNARIPLGLAALLLIAACRVGAAEAVIPIDVGWVNPWRNLDGSIAFGSVLDYVEEDGVVPASTAGEPVRPGMEGARIESYRLAASFPGADPIGDDGMATEAVNSGMAQAPPDAGDYQAMIGAGLPVPPPRDEFNRLGGSTATILEDRGIDSADTKWRRQARLQGVRMRMLNGPEAAFAWDGYSSDTERGWRGHAGAVVPLNPRWELAILDKTAFFEQKEDGRTAGLEALTLRLGANPSQSFRPWVAVTPYVGLDDGDGVGVGLSGGVMKSWQSGMSLRGEAYAWQPWDEGYDTAAQDGRSHGVRIQGTMPVDRRLTLTGGIEYEWLELGPHAPGGSQYAGRRGGWNIRAEYLLLKRDDAYMGYGFREQTLWDEQLVPVELGVFADISWQRYIRPDGFEVLSPTRKSLRERVGLFYNQAVSPHIGFNAEAFVGQDPRRGIGPGELYGVTLRLNLVINPHWRIWGGWGYESNRDTLAGGGGPDRYFSFGLNYNF